MSEKDINLIRILVVEDHELTRIGLRMLFAKEPDLELVAEAQDGRTAVQRSLELKPDVVLMDIMLPRMSGIDATLEIKNANPNIKIIMCSSQESDDKILGAFAAGADAYCLKTAPVEQLVRAIRGVVKGSVWVDPAIAGRVLKELERIGKMPKDQSNQDHMVPLTEGELDLLRPLTDGLDSQRIAEQLLVSWRIMKKMAAYYRGQATIKAIQPELI